MTSGRQRAHFLTVSIGSIRQRDEDLVYVFSLYQTDRVYRFRLSLTGTLSSMLRGRNRADEDRILGVYLNWIREQIDADRAGAEILNEKMFNSKDHRLFLAE